MRVASCSQSSFAGCASSWVARCLSLHTRLLPSLSKYHPCLSLLSFVLPSLFIFESLQFIPSPQLYPTAPPLSTPCPSCCSIFLVALKINPSILLILFFLSFAPLIVVGANGIVFFFLQLY
jgi:hypothetical protein